MLSPITLIYMSIDIYVVPCIWEYMGGTISKAFYAFVSLCCKCIFTEARYRDKKVNVPTPEPPTNTKRADQHDAGEPSHRCHGSALTTTATCTHAVPAEHLFDRRGQLQERRRRG